MLQSSMACPCKGPPSLPPAGPVNLKAYSTFTNWEPKMREGEHSGTNKGGRSLVIGSARDIRKSKQHIHPLPLCTWPHKRTQRRFLSHILQAFRHTAQLPSRIPVYSPCPPETDPSTISQCRWRVASKWRNALVHWSHLFACQVKVYVSGHLKTLVLEAEG